jgi:hypothetical protein
MVKKNRRSNVQIVVRKKARPKRVYVEPIAGKAKKQDQVTLLGQALRTLGGLGGGAMGSMFGQSLVGSNVGRSLGASISKWLGSGDYSVKSNSLVTRSLRSSDAIPEMHKFGDNIVVRHREYVTEVKSSTNFNVGRYFIIQPGDTNTFPWLSGIADKFQQYRIKGMVFHYIPTSGHAISGTNPAIGTVMLQTTYRVNDSSPTSKVEMLNEYWASEASPAEAFCHPIECAPSENPFAIHYVRTKPVPADDSPLMYDLGKTFVATSGMPGDGNVVGDLWVSYEIEFSKPVVSSSVTAAQYSGSYTAANPVTGNWFPSLVTDASSSLAVTWVGNTLSFPIGIVGNFMGLIRIYPNINFTAVDVSGAPSYTNCSGLAIDSSGSFYARTVVQGGVATTGNFFYEFAVSLTNPAAVATVTFPNGTWTGAALTGYLVLVQL